MTTAPEPLILDLVAWARTPRPYAEALETWRTSCPRLTVWEDAFDAGLVACRSGADGTLLVAATTRGEQALAGRRAG